MSCIVDKFIQTKFVLICLFFEKQNNQYVKFYCIESLQTYLQNVY